MSFLAQFALKIFLKQWESKEEEPNKSSEQGVALG